MKKRGPANVSTAERERGRKFKPWKDDRNFMRGGEGGAIRGEAGAEREKKNPMLTPSLGSKGRPGVRVGNNNGKGVTRGTTSHVGGCKNQKY